MKTRKLIELLKKVPAEADVYYVWDGAARGEADRVWETADGRVIIGTIGEYCTGEDVPNGFVPNKESGHGPAHYDIK